MIAFVVLPVPLLIFISCSNIWIFISFCVIKSKYLLLWEESQIIVIPFIKAELNACVWEREFEVCFNSKHAVMIFLVNQNVLYLFLVTNHVATKGHSNFLLIVRNDQVENFNVFWACRNGPFLFYKIVWLISDNDLILQCHYVSITVLEIGSNGSFPVPVIYCNLEIMIILSSVNHKSRLVLSISHAKSFQWTKHHLCSLHEVVHNIFKLWHQCFLINDIEVNLIFTHNLNTDITFDEVNLTACVVKFIILMPVRLVAFFIEYFLEEENRTGGARDQGFVKY